MASQHVIILIKVIAFAFFSLFMFTCCTRKRAKKKKKCFPWKVDKLFRSGGCQTDKQKASGISALLSHSLQSGSCWCVCCRGSWHNCRCPPLLRTRPYPAWHPARCSSRSCPPPCCLRGGGRERRSARSSAPTDTSKKKAQREADSIMIVKLSPESRIIDGRCAAETDAKHWGYYVRPSKRLFFFFEWSWNLRRLQSLQRQLWISLVGVNTGIKCSVGVFFFFQSLAAHFRQRLGEKHRRPWDGLHSRFPRIIWLIDIPTWYQVKNDVNQNRPDFWIFFS